MSTFEILGRYRAVPPAPDWREQLAARLGARPRRIGLWAELALFGALECLTDADEHPLAADANILVASQSGPVAATREVFAQVQGDLPMPLIFLQTQPSQMLAVLAAHLGWRGNANFTCHPKPAALVRLAAAQCGPAGMLLGWVDEPGAGSTSWLRLRPAMGEVGGFQAALFEDVFALDATYLNVSRDGLEISTA